MRRIRQMTIQELLTAVGAYRSLVGATLVVVLILVFLPGTRSGGDDSTEAVASNSPGAVLADGGSTTDGGPTEVGGGTPGSVVSSPGSSQSASTVLAGAPAPETAGAPVASADTSSPNCDPATGRIRVPTFYAPPCLPEFSGDNGGATYQGVTADTITIAVYRVQRNPAVDAVVASSGAQDSDQDIEQSYLDYLDYFQDHFETYGRKLKLVYVEASGPPDDDVAARADAVRVATEIKAFASWFDPSVEVGGTYAYVQELIARGVLCIVCTYAQPDGNYAKWAPYVWVPSLTYEQSADLVIEYIGKRLAGKPAKWAGDPLMQSKQRTFALIEYDNYDGDFSFAPAYWRQEMAKYGVTLTDAITYPFDATQAQTQSRTIVARLKDKGITSVVMYTDPIYPIFITGEATRQAYNPEWIITGTGLTDTTLFGRLFDQSQWSHAFGVGWSPARSPQEQGDAYRLHVWHHGRPPKAANTYGITYGVPWLFFTGVHSAGPNLTPKSYAEGMFKYPPSGGGITTALISWGNHGLWPVTDYGSIDDVTEIWWDATTTGEDEVGAEGRGMYRYVDGGKRIRPGAWPNTDTKAFDPDGTVTVYQDLPAADRPPKYEHQQHQS